MEKTSIEIQKRREGQGHHLLHQKEVTDHLKGMKETGQGHQRGGKDQYIEDLYPKKGRKETTATQVKEGQIPWTDIEDQGQKTGEEGQGQRTGEEDQTPNYTNKLITFRLIQKSDDYYW